MDDTPNKAIEAVVIELGGSKAVAPLLWPSKTVEEARRLLCDCLNDDRPAKLDFAQVLHILRLGRERGIHTGMDYICATLGYAAPQPVEPRDELADLLRRHCELMEQSNRLSARIGALAGPALKAVA